jgi:pimeloyl-ACP methyl ester carboxylesterase
MSPALAHEESGEGEAVVLIHGHPFDRSLWLPQLRPLASAGFRVVAPDLRGYGESPATPGKVSMRELAGDVVALLDRLDIERAAVVGLSMGGLVAMELALGWTQRVWAIGLVATTAEPVSPGESQQRLELAAAVEAQGMAPLVRYMHTGVYGPKCPPEVVNRIDRMMADGNPIGAAAALRGRAERPDYRAGLSALAVPSFVCTGDADPWSNSQVTDELTACLRSPEILLLEEVGHLPNLEATDRFNDSLAAFLRRAAETGADSMAQREA